VTGTAEDALLTSLIEAAREADEAEANVSLVTRTLKLATDMTRSARARSGSRICPRRASGP
jgi:hypothetical protein